MKMYLCLKLFIYFYIKTFRNRLNFVFPFLSSAAHTLDNKNNSNVKKDLIVKSKCFRTNLNVSLPLSCVVYFLISSSCRCSRR